MRRTIILIAALLLSSIPEYGRNNYDEVLADLDKAGGYFYAYPMPTAELTPAPDGYKPFYISHFGRHGSRWHTSGDVYTRPVVTLRRASEAGVLTPLGKELLDRLVIIAADAEGRAGQLTAKGYRQHQEIATRMYQRFPEVFQGKVHLTANATKSPRVIVSMMAFCDALKAQNPLIDITEDVTSKDAVSIAGRSAASESYIRSPRMRKLVEDSKVSHNHGERLCSTLFTDPSFLDAEEQYKLYFDIKEVALVTQNTDLDISLYDFFTPQELLESGRAYDYEYATRIGITCDSAGVMKAAAVPMLRRMIEVADEAIAGGGTAATLRFTHDSYIAPLTSTLGFDLTETTVDEYYLYKDCPMAANVQLVFYRNKDGHVLVKFLHNENETSVPVPTSQYPYYDWDTVRQYYIDRYGLVREPQHKTMEFQGHEREYYIYIPEKMSEARPLVFMLHGYTGHAKDYYRDFLRTADKYGFAVCYPQGLTGPTPEQKTGWNVGYPFQEGWDVDDCGFILALSGQLQKEYGLDGRNVFFSGMSNGGEMCYLMAHRYPEKFAAIASLAGLNMEWIYRTMKPSCAVPFMEVHGTQDMTSRWEGDPENKDGWGRYIGVPQAVGRMVSNNCCTHEVCDTLPVIRNRVIRHQYVGGTEGKNVVLYEIIGGGHSTGEKDMDLGEEIWKFFRRYLTK